MLCVYVVCAQQNVGKSMSSSKFVSNLDGMNEGENFGKDLLKVSFFSVLLLLRRCEQL